MPVVGIPVDMLLARLQTPLDRESLVEHLQHLGCDVEGYATLHRYRCQRCDNILEITATENPPVLCERCGTDFKENESARIELGESDVIRMELLAVRPDMFDPGGLARVLRSYLGESSGLVDYPLQPPVATVLVDEQLAQPTSLRPWIACAIVRGIHLDDDAIKVIMKLQENLHWALGRDRKHASIGVYDLDTVAGSETGAGLQFRYRSVGPEELRFTPLGYDPADPAAALTPAAVLADHPKGKAYARLLEGFERYPLLQDGAGQVLSLPPIINSEQTRVRQSTTNFFIDVTGTDERIVGKTLNIVVTSLLELDPAVQVEQVRIRYTHGERITPNLEPQRVELAAARAPRLIGVALDQGQVAALLAKMGHRVEQGRGGLLQVGVPAYRNDIMHPIDLIEDVAIAYGYHNIETQLVPTMTVGAERPERALAGRMRQALTGLGYFEVMTLILSSEEQQFDLMRLPRATDAVEIAHPISVEQTIVRSALLPGLLDTLAVNTDHELPQYIFEVGNVSAVDPSAETGAREHGRVAAAAIGPRVDFSLVRSICEALLRELGWQLELVAEDCPSYLPGRCARVWAVAGEQRHTLGLLGELHPEVLESYKLVQPTAGFELALEALGAA